MLHSELPGRLWRHANRGSFITELPLDPERPRAWLADPASLADRLLLVVELDDRTAAGHVGLASIDLKAGSAEIDNVLRGRPTPGTSALMTSAVRSLMKWAVVGPGIRRLWLRVFEGNSDMGSYQRFGFVIEGLDAPLHQSESEGTALGNRPRDRANESRRRWGFPRVDSVDSSSGRTFPDGPPCLPLASCACRCVRRRPQAPCEPPCFLAESLRVEPLDSFISYDWGGVREH